MKVIFAVTKLFFWVAFSANVHKGKGSIWCIEVQTLTGGTQVWVKSERKENRSERLWWVSLWSKRDRKDRTTARGCHGSGHTHTHTHKRAPQTEKCSCLTNQKEHLTIRRQTNILFLFLFFFLWLSLSWSTWLALPPSLSLFLYLVFLSRQRQRHLKDPYSAALTCSWPWLRRENPSGPDKDSGASGFPLLHTSRYVLSHAWLGFQDFLHILSTFLYNG